MTRAGRSGAVLIALVAVAGLGGWWGHARLTTPYRAFTQNEVFVDLAPGTGQRQIARQLVDAGVVPDVWTFRLATYLARADRRLQAGEYRFTEPASPFEVVDRLVRGDVYAVSVTFPEGLTVGEMAGIFERSGAGTAAAFQAAADDSSLVAALDPDAADLEGYLFPSTYAISRRAGAPAAVRAMVAQFKRAFDAGLRAEASAQRLSVREAVTLASLVEKETAQPDERPLVAAVYRNRLRLGMPLQCDPTVIYALMRRGVWNGNVTKADLQIDSPYNTYRHSGLPPGPIASPGRASLEAAVRPADVPYLYFVSRNDGTHVFSSTLAEHNRNVAKWQKGRR